MLYFKTILVGFKTKNAKGDEMKFFYEKRENEFYVQKSKNLAFAAHFHSSIEIVYILKGSAHAFSAGNDCTLNEGDLFVAFPNCIHYYDNCSSDLLYYIAIIPYSAFPEYKLELTEMISSSPKIEGVSPEVALIFDKILNTHGDYKERIIKAYFSAMLGIIFKKTDFINVSGADNNAVQAIIKFCRENYTNNISLDDISNYIHISKSRISHIFSEKLHISFRTFLNAFRLNDAGQLLSESELSVIEIAMQVGFESVRTFNRAFLKHFGKSPAAYRKMSKIAK